ncbi:MAG: hypothetical protein AUG51_19335 [Acidobacteria bacterium 13_1_20CM_3_53_8]|nr:MAG: hypothetical protein AUG51_19335 [Acidobacteria bacterium 13_1_20CM_3_53_8]
MAGMIERKYGVATTIDLPMIKRGVADYAVSADWTPAAGDCKISKDEGADANTTNLPSAVASATAKWKLDLTATEMQAKRIFITIIDQGTKAVEDQSVIIETYGHASAQSPVDYDNAASLGLTNLDAAVSSRSTYAGADTAGTTTLLSRIASALTITGGKVDVNDKTGFSLSAAAVQAIWDALTSALTTAGSIGKRLTDSIDATISSRSSHTAADVWAVGTRTLTAFSFAVDLSSSALGAIWDRLTSAITTAGSIGRLIKDNLDAAVSSRASAADYTSARAAKLDNLDAMISSRSSHTPANVRAEMDANSTKLQNLDATVSSRSSHSAADVWVSPTRTLSSFGTLVADIWAAVVDSSGVATLLSRLTAARATKLDNLDAAITTRSAHTPGDVRAEMDANSLDLDAIIAYVDELEARLTATRAGLLDNLSLVDVALSSRLAMADYVAPDNARIASAEASLVTLLARLSATRATLLDSLPLLDVAVSTRLASNLYTAPDNETLLAAKATLDEFSFVAGDVRATLAGEVVMADVDVSAIADEVVARLVNVTDPLGTQVPGSYASGTAGHALGRIGSAQVVTVSPVTASGSRVETVRGDDYAALLGRALEWTDQSAQWPDLTGATVTLTAKFGGQGFSKNVQIIVAAGPGKRLRLELMGSETSTILVTVKPYRFQIVAHLATNQEVTLVRGEWISVEKEV